MKWIKDNDQEIETNDLPATIEKCESMGWKPAKAAKLESVDNSAPKKKPGRPAKTDS